jgi:hypothetical protein
MKNKKASLELSIRAIVIVVLAMTLLGLGLAFVKNIFGSAEELSESAFNKVSDQLQRDLLNSNEKLVFSQTKVNLQRGKSSLLGWGIMNNNPSELSYWAEFTAIKCPGLCPTKQNINNEWFTFKYNPNGDIPSLLYSVDTADQSIKRVDLTIPKTAQTGLYLVDLSVYEEQGQDDPKYSSTEVFITVT